LLLALAAGSAPATDARSDGAITLVIDGVDGDLASQGLSAADLRRDLAAGLESAGMHVVDADVAAAAARAPTLELRLRLMRAPYYFYLYNVKLTLNSPVALIDGGTTMLPTWSDGWIGLLMPDEVSRVNGFAQELLARYLAQGK
jgi:hypothetical protein